MVCDSGMLKESYCFHLVTLAQVSQLHAGIALLFGVLAERGVARMVPESGGDNKFSLTVFI